MSAQKFLEKLRLRRSIYALGRDIEMPKEEIIDLIQDVVKESPTAFNSQTQRVVTLFGPAHEKLWDLTAEALKPLTPAEAYPNTLKKIQGFKNGLGTVLFFEDQSVVKGLQEQFSLYADNFPVWSEQASGLTTENVWVALSIAGLGANLQHYNPVIDDAVAKEWNIPADWKLRSQLVFGSVESPAQAKEYIDDADRFKVFGA